METQHISKAVIQRLPRYYRYLGILMDQGVERISSGELSRIMHVTASQIRQDFNHFGGFGQQGYGYNVSFLYQEFAALLGLDKEHYMIIIGAGNLGRALASYVLFEKRGFHVIGIFDHDRKLDGSMIRDIPVMMTDTLESFLKTNRVDIAALTLPSIGAVEVCPVLIRSGIRAIWNFAHTDLDVPDHVIVENVHLSESLMQLSYRLNEMEERSL